MVCQPLTSSFRFIRPCWLTSTSEFSWKMVPTRTAVGSTVARGAGQSKGVNPVESATVCAQCAVQLLLRLKTWVHMGECDLHVQG